MDDVSIEPVILPNHSVIPTSKRPSRMKVSEVYLDGKLKKAELIDEAEKSFGIFMHSLILSNYAEVMKVNSHNIDVVGDDCEKAIFYYTASKGFDKKLIESIAPRVKELSFEDKDHLKVSTHLINEKMRIVSKGSSDALLKRCTHILIDSKFIKITRKIYREVNSVMADMLNRCVNVYAIAIKDISKMQNTFNTDFYVRDMALVALVGMGRA